MQLSLKKELVYKKKLDKTFIYQYPLYPYNPVNPIKPIKKMLPK
jgi:hypothetical protein